MPQPLTCVVLSIGCLIAGCSGGGAASSPEYGQPPPVTGKELAKQDVSSTVPLQIETDEGRITLAAPAGAFAEPTTVRVRAATAQPPIDKVGKVIRAYDVETSAEMKQTATLTFSYADATLAPDVAAEDQLKVAFYHPEMRSWVQAHLKSVDTTSRTVTVETDHFSVWTLWGILGEYKVDNTSPRFRIHWDPNINASGMGARNVEQYKDKTREVLEKSYTAYTTAGFTAPVGKIDVYVVDAEESAYNPLTGNVIISSKSYDDNATIHEIAHELFHLFQNRQINLKSMDWRRWFVEGAADYAADKVAMSTGMMGATVKPDHFQVYLTTVDGKHEYALAHLIHYLVGRGVDFKELQDAVFKDWQFTDRSESAFADHIKTKTSKSFAAHHAAFAAALLFPGTGSLKGTAKLYDTISEQKVTITDSDNGKAIDIAVKDGYAVKILGLKMDLDTSKSVELTVTGGVVPAVVLAPGDSQSGALPVAQAAATGKFSGISANHGDSIYVMAAADAKATVRVTVALTEQQRTCWAMLKNCSDSTGQQPAPTDECSGSALIEPYYECVNDRCTLKEKVTDCAKYITDTSRGAGTCGIPVRCAGSCGPMCAGADYFK